MAPDLPGKNLQPNLYKSSTSWTRAVSDILQFMVQCVRRQQRVRRGAWKSLVLLTCQPPVREWNAGHPPEWNASLVNESLRKNADAGWSPVNCHSGRADLIVVAISWLLRFGDLFRFRFIHCSPRQWSGPTFEFIWNVRLLYVGSHISKTTTLLRSTTRRPNNLYSVFVISAGRLRPNRHFSMKN